MIAYFKSFHRQTTIPIYLTYYDKSNIFSILIRNSPTYYLCNRLNSVRLYLYVFLLLFFIPVNLSIVLIKFSPSVLYHLYIDINTFVYL